MINETRFGSVTALQEEIARLQEQIKQLQTNRGPLSNYPNQTLSRELSSSHQLCREMYYSNASLWRELYTLKNTNQRLQKEMKLLLDVMSRIFRGESNPLTEEVLTSLTHITTDLIDRNCYSSIVLFPLPC